MLNWIIDASLRRRGIVLMLAAVLVLFGAWSLSELSIDAFPDVTDVMVQINTVAPSLSPEEVERQISVRIEQAMGGLPNLRLLRSMSKFGLSQVTLVFEDGTDLYFARAQVLERLSRLELPEGFERPTMGPVATGLGEIFHYIVTAPGGDLAESRAIHDLRIKPALLAARGVAEVNSWGGFEKRFEVVARPDRLVKHRVTLAELMEALRKANLNVGGGQVEAGGEILLVHGVGAVTTVEEIGGVPLKAADGRPVRVRDVADVRLGHEQRRGVVTAEGRGEAMLGLGFLLMGENSHEVARRLRERLDEVRPSLPEGTEVRVVYDRTELVDHVLDTVKKNLCESMILVVAVLFLFMGHFRAACIVALAIPLSMMFAFSVMLRAGIAGTLMSLGALDFGLLVDSSVIMVENSVRRLEESDAPVVDVVADASKEVRAPTMFGELIIMLVYVPILALHGVEGKLFKPMALTVIFALAGSLLLSLSLMPVLASLVLRRRGHHREPWTIRALKRLYSPLVEWAVDNRFLVLGAAVIVIVGTIPLAMRRGAEFVPKLDEGSLVINTVRLPGVSVEESARFATDIERTLLAEFPREIRSIWTRTGTPEVATDPMGIEVSDVFIMLTPRDAWRRARTKDELKTQMRRSLDRLPGMNYSFTQPIEMRFNEMISGVRTDVGLMIYGADFDRLRELSERARQILASIRGAESVNPEPLVGQPVLEIRLRPDELSRHGLSARDVLDHVEAVGGIDVSEIREGNAAWPLVVRLPDAYAQNPDLAGEILVVDPGGARLPLRRLADIRRVAGPMVVNRDWGRRRAIVSCNVSGRDLAGFVAEAKRRIDAELGPDLVRLGYPKPEWGGQFENLERAFRTLTWVVPVVLVLILALVFATYGNWPDALRVFTGVPFAAVGGLWALALRDIPFSVSAGVGFIALSGISVLADMVMVSTIRQLVAEGMDLRSATIEAARRRLRPVLMTSITTGIGFLPMAVNTGLGAEVQRPLATVVIGGVITSTLLTLVVLPTLYAWIGRAARPAAPPRAVR